jgi:hypothetical protein
VCFPVFHFISFTTITESHIRKKKNSTATTWALFALTQAPNAQAKLREELLKVPTDNPTMDDLSALPFLDAVVRESLRVHSPVPSTVRIATKDDVIPLNTPFVDKNGQTHHGIKCVVVVAWFVLHNRAD